MVAAVVTGLVGIASAGATQIPTANASGTLSMPSGLSLTVTQPSDAIAATVTNNNMGIAGRYAGSALWSNSAYTPGVATNTSPYSWYSKIDNSNTSGASDCLDRTKLRDATMMRCAKGDLTYAFSRPVKNPTFHISNIGGWTWWSVGGANGVWPRMSHHMDLILTLDTAGSSCTSTPGLSLRSSLGNFQVTTDGTTWGLAAGDSARLDGKPAITRSSATLVGGNTYAAGKLGSGSVQVTGTCSSVTFNRDLLWQFAYATSANLDAGYVVDATALSYYNCLIGQFPLATTTSNMTQCTTVSPFQLTGSPNATVTQQHLQDPPDAGGSFGWMTHRYGEETDMTWSVDEDFGDAPSTFDASNGASHVLSDLAIGAGVSSTGAETVATAGVAPNNVGASGIVSPIANGADALDDAFALAAPTLTAGTAYSVTVPVSGASAAGQVCGFLDLNASGTFTTASPDERQCAAISSGTTSVTLTWPGTSTSTVAANTRLRLRAAYGATALAPTGRLDSGEVEDWAVALTAPAPTASPDTTSGLQGATQTINLLTNDAAGSGATLSASSVRLCGSGETSPACTQTSVSVTNVGTYSVGNTGVMTFTPLANYSGTPAALPYIVQDNLGQTAASTYTPTVTGTPSATADTTSGAKGATQSINLLTNDTAGFGTTLTASSVRLCGTSETSPACTQTSVSVTNVGTYSVSNTGVMTFTPLASYTGTPTALPYIVKDNLNQVAASTYTPTVIDTPTATADTTSGLQGATQSINLLTNDAAGSGATLTASSVRLCGAGQVSPACTQTSVTVNNVGTYAVSNTGVMTFTPVALYVGTPAALPYIVKDNLNQTATSTYTPTVAGTPTATADTTTGAKGATQSINLLTNDTAGFGTTLTASSVLLCGTNETSPTCTQTSVTVNNVGTYSVSNTGVMTFTPLASYNGTPTALPYIVKDNLNQVAASAYTPTVIDTPTATADTTTGAKGATQTINLLTNDAAGSGATLTASSVRLCGTGETSPACTQTSVTVTNVGTYSVSNTGVMTFTPVASYSGTPAALPYIVKDNLDQVAASTYTPTVIDTPTATADTTTGAKGATQTINLLTNDAAATGATLTASSVRLCGSGETSPACTQTSVTVNNVGTYSVSNTGVMTFTPLASYVGTPTALPYIVKDNLNQVAASTYTPTVVPPLTAMPDSTTGLQGQPQTISLLTNDTPGTGATLVASTVRLCGTGETSPACTQTSVTVNNVGTYAVSNTGVMTFTPVAGYTGTPTGLPYIVTDSLSQTVGSTYTPTVLGSPTATPDTTTGAKGATQTINLLTNDTAGFGTTLTASTVRLCGSGETSPACTQTSVTVNNVGTYSVNGSGGITFTPLANYVGTPTALPYIVKDNVDQVAASTYTPTIIDTPTATADTTSGLQGATQTISLITNDSAATGATLTASSVRLCGTGETSPACTQTTVTVNNVGTYTVNASGVMTFTPVASHSGTPPALPYIVKDNLNQVAASTYTPTVIGPPAATPDTTSGLQGATQTINLLTNDTAGFGATLTASSVRLCGAGETSPACTQTSVTVNGVGTYSVSNTGVMTFTPLMTYSGTPLPLPYVVTDSSNQVAASTYTPTVVPPPVASTDSTRAPQGQVQTINLLTNDIAGPGATAVPSSVRLCGTSETSPACTQTSVFVSGVGTYAVDNAGNVTFTPLLSYTGTPSAIAYIFQDTRGQTAASTYQVIVDPVPPPVAQPDATSGVQAMPQSANLLGNDAAGTGGTLTRSSVLLCGAGQTSPACTRTSVTVIGVGLYEVNAVGVMTFTPEPSYVGTPAPLPYIVSDNVTQIAASTYTPTVVVSGPPVAMPDITSGAQGQEQSISLLTNDSAATGAVLTATSVRLCGSGEISPACTQTSVIVPGVGTYTVGSTGTITFSPEPQYVGTPQALPYIVRDHIGQVAASTYTPTVVAPPTPPSSTSSVPQGAPRLAITTTPSRVVLRLGQTSVITLRVTNSGTATAKKTVTRALIPDNFVVVKTNGGRVVGRYIIFATGDLPPRRGATRTFVVRPTAAAIGHTAPVVGRSVGTNVKRVTDPTALRVVGPRPHRAPVTG